MREFGKIQTQFWTHPKIRRVDFKTRLLFTYLLSNRHMNGLGCYYCPPEYVAADLDLPIKDIRKGYAIGYKIGFLKYCEVTGYLLIHDFLEWNRVDGPKQGQAREKDLREIPRYFAFMGDLVKEIRKLVSIKARTQNTLSDTLLDTLSDTLSDTPSNEREREGEIEREIPPPISPPTKSKSQSKTRATRIPEDWLPDKQGLLYAKQKGMSQETILEEIPRFRDYWLGNAKNPTSPDWGARWRTWVRNHFKFKAERQAALDDLPDATDCNCQAWANDENFTCDCKRCRAKLAMGAEAGIIIEQEGTRP